MCRHVESAGYCGSRLILALTCATLFPTMTSLRLLPLAALALLTACSPSPQDAASANRAVLGGTGEAVGSLPDGREVVRYVVYGPDTSREHTIYVVNGSITVNRPVTVRSGKNSHIEIRTEVLIDGVVYVPKTP